MLTQTKPTRTEMAHLAHSYRKIVSYYHVL